MSKRNNVSYIKPADPKFLQQLKAQIGYKEGPTVETKRQKLEYDSDSGSDPDEEAPQVVVLKKGDLTAEEAEQEKQRIEKEESEKPADLNQRIVFKSKKSEKPTTSEQNNIETKVENNKKEKKRNRPAVNKSKLSFQDADDGENEEDE